MDLIKDNWLVGLFFLLFFLELIIYHRGFYKKNKVKEHWKTNVINFIATKIVGIVIIVPILLLSSKYSTHMLSNITVWLSLPVGLVLLDLSGYIFHRISHEIEFLWRFHEIHHLDEILDVSTSLRVHFLEAFFHAILNCLFIYLFGITQETIAIHAVVSFIFATYHHSRFKTPLIIERKLSLFITTPRYHEPHHDRDINNNQSNYAFIFPIWDFIFSTYHKQTFDKSWEFGLSYSKDINAIRSLTKPLGKDGGK